MIELKIEAAAPDAAGAAAALAASLCQAREPSNRRFAAVGARLQDCGGVLDGIVGAFEALPRELQGSQLAEATARLAGLGDRVAGLMAAFLSERESTTGLHATVQSVRAPVDDLEKTARLVSILALNAHVVAADSASVGGGLETIAAEATRLADAAATRIVTFRAVYRRLVEAVHGAAAQQAEFDARHGRTLGDVTASIQAHLAALERHRAAAAAGLAETGRITREVAQGVTRAVMSLQIGDATHQRMEHVETALALAGSEEGESAGGTILSLQAHLLASAAAHLEQEAGALQAALLDLHAQAESMVDQGRRSYGAGDRADGSVLAALSSEVQRAAAVLTAYERERRKLDAMAAGVTATVADLVSEVDAVRRIERNMRMLSLNATTRCARQGVETRGFDVIAQQLREITTRLVECADSAMSGLGTASQLAARLLESASSGGADQVELLLAEATESIAILEGVEARLDAALLALGREGPKATRDLRAAAETFDGSAPLIALLREAEAETAELAAAHPGMGDVPAELLARLRKLYTMASERQVHDGFVGAPPPAEEAAPAAAAAEEIEFF